MHCNYSSPMVAELLPHQVVPPQLSPESDIAQREDVEGGFLEMSRSMYVVGIVM